MSDRPSILITGDFCPVNRISNMIIQRKFDFIFNDFSPFIRNVDLAVTNLECPLTIATTAIDKIGPLLKASHETAEALAYAGIDLVTLANNHIMDYGSRGASETTDLCRENGIATIGIGRTKEEAKQEYSINIKGKRIAILNYADNEFVTAPDGSYTCNPIDKIQCFNDIKIARQSHDYIIVIVHAGNEFYELPSPRTKELYRYIVDLGADIVLAHHTHSYSGYEIYNSKPIFYGLGNFIYDWPGKTDSHWNRGYVVRLRFSDKIEFDIIPLKQGNGKPGVFHLDEDEIQVFNTDIDRLNQIIVDDQQLEAEFQRYCKSVYPMYDAFIEPYFGKYITALQKRGFLPKLLSRKKRLLLLNLTRCESHRDVLLRMLKQYE